MRKANGILALVIAILFAAHAALGALSQHVDIPHALAPLVWVGVALAVAHIVMCLFTSRSMLTDTVRPPSDKKKRHLALKWVTGAALVAAVVAHIIIGTETSGKVAVVAVAVFLALHVCTGMKSLLKDLGWPRSLRDPLRVACCIILAVAALALVLA